MVDRSELLRGPAVADLPDDQIDWFISKAEELRLQAGTMGFRQGDPADSNIESAGSPCRKPIVPAWRRNSSALLMNQSIWSSGKSATAGPRNSSDLSTI